MDRELSDIELMIWVICLKKGESSARVIWEELIKNHEQSYNATRIELSRIVEKGYLTKRKFGPIWLYSTKIDRSNIFSKIHEKYMKIFDDQFFPLALHFIENTKISKSQMEELKKLIDQFKDDE